MPANCVAERVNKPVRLATFGSVAINSAKDLWVEDGDFVRTCGRRTTEFSKPKHRLDQASSDKREAYRYEQNPHTSHTTPQEPDNSSNQDNTTCATTW